MAIILPSLNFNSLILSTLFTLLIFTTTTTNGALQQKDITLNLIHRDSPLSPLYNPSLNKTDRLRNMFQRSISRVNRFSPKSSGSPKDIGSTVYSARGEYVIGLSFGTPPVSQIGIIDTGSDLIWTQCQPCVHCYEQSTPIFDPRKSSTYKIVPCRSKECQYVGSEQRLCSKKNICGYLYTYGDSSSTTGDVATDTLTFESENRDKASLPNVIIGCGHDNQGTFGEQKISSLIGLGGGPLSLASQLGSSTGGKFSYCLVPFASEEWENFTSKLYFGTKGEVSGRGVVSTPLVKSSTDTFYTLTLEGLSVGDEKIPFYNPKKSSTSSFDDYGTSEGNIIIDSGTTLTLLPSDLYESLSTALERAIQGRKTQDPQGQLELCYEATKDLKIPNVTAHFTGADLVLNQVNTFVDTSESVVCLAILESDQAIWGNIAQINFLVGYDTKEGKVSFKPTDCTKEV